MQEDRINSADEDRSDHIWQRPPQPITLSANEVHAWRVPLQTAEDSYIALQQVLSADERERARRFYFEKDRRTWTIAHGVLRILLARYLQTTPQELHFVTNSYGKPELARPFADMGLQFNLSHSATLALMAFTYRRQVGIDVEYMRDNIEWDALARSQFSAPENAALLAVPPEQQREAFFLCWSRKEAYIKAKGMGLSLPLDQFDVALVPGEPAALLASREDALATTRWSLHALEPGTSYAGALVVEGHDWHLRCWQWQ